MRAGFTIIETLTAAVVLAISLFVIGAAFFGEFNVINKISDSTIAALAAQEEVDKVRSLPFDSIASSTHSGYNASDPMSPSGFQYLINKNPSCVINSSLVSAGLKKVTVTVNWTSSSGSALSKSLVTLVTHNGIDRQ